ncbi:MAG: N-acetyltransferase [Oscillatoriales cyanobacterium RM1_1_9]|nr:N-acetyltransferase [Oscillatoriales cyanobacterium SM2_3_0]NJO46025.1 N-acetyltransferase [Oscillatoriales cyanobacterium RM2_1_1]NJO70982.1 N-acetyltransferase [Oscillatoriales cyanobacterium RM1_1_9]
MIRSVESQDVGAICRIYNYYIRNTIITFEEVEVSNAEMQARIHRITPFFPWLVWMEVDEVLGYAYGRPWHTRSAYRFAVESGIYLDHQAVNRGIGSTLYQELFTQLRNRQFQTVIGGISLPNSASIALHEKFGFEKVAHFKSVGYKFDQWIDVGYWQLLLNSLKSN